MIFLFSKKDISTAIGIPEREAAEFLRLKLFQYGITANAKNFSVKSVVDLIWELNMNTQYCTKSNFDIMFSAWSSTFKEANTFANITTDTSDLIQVEIL